MSSRTAKRRAAVTVELLLDPDLARACGGSEGLGTAVSLAIETAVAQAMRELGIPGRPVLAVQELPAPDRRRLLGVAVGGQRLHYPAALLPWVQSYVLGAPPDPDWERNRLSAWMHDLARAPTPEERDRLVRFLSLATVTVLHRRPSRLLSDEPLAAYRAALPVPPGVARRSWPPGATWLRQVLAAVLDLGISLADVAVVAGTLAEAAAEPAAAAERLAAAAEPAAVAERLAAALRPAALELHLPRSRLRELTMAYGDRGDLFELVRSGLLGELGMSYPPFRLVADDQLEPWGLAVRVNHVMELPIVALRADQCLVNDSASRLAQALPAEPASGTQPIATLDPAHERHYSIVPLELQARLDSMGYTTWNPLEFVALLLGRVLRQRGHVLVTRSETERWLGQLPFPKVVEAVRARFSTEQLTRVLRALAAEQVSIGDLARILERLLDYDGQMHARSAYLASYDRLPAGDRRTPDRPDDFATLLAFVRASLQRQISAKYAGGTATMVAYLLDREIEETLAQAPAADGDGRERPPLREGERARIVAAIEKELAWLAPALRPPVILTDARVRGALAGLLSEEYPGIAAVAYQELVPELNVQPVARISLSE
jgi:type III secretory pathway component EscV